MGIRLVRAADSYSLPGSDRPRWPRQGYTMSSFARTVYRGLFHLRNGTLMNRVTARWRDARDQRRGFRKCEVEPGVRLRLHRDSELARWIAKGGFEVTERRFVKAYLHP